MKYLFAKILILSVLFLNENKAIAQFSSDAKKKAIKPTVTDNSATKEIPLNVNIQDTSKNKKATTTPATVYDTTIVGGFNSNTKRSLRNGYAFFSESNSRKGVKDRLPLPYENLREEDALFSEFVWEEIDAREKLNRTFLYQAYDDNGDQRFFAVLLRAIEKDGVVPFSAAEDDRFTTPMTIDEIKSMVNGELETQEVADANDPNLMIPTVRYNSSKQINPDSIYTFRLKEQWIFDSKTSRMYSRIIGIAPIASKRFGNKVIKVPLFWVYYPELRASLAKSEVYNPRNISSRITWEELFESRYFNGYVIKSSLDNYNDKLLNALYKDPVKRLQEGDKIKQKIFDFEQDRWVY